MSQMACPNCQDKDNKTKDTREHPVYNWIKRRRECNSCGHRWNTLEVNEDIIEEAE